MGAAGEVHGPLVDDHVQRDFSAQRPDQVWVTDLIDHPTAEGKLYCCAIKDLFSNRIVGDALDERMTAQLAVTALRTAVARRQPNGVVVVHSGRGSQFRARSIRAVLAAAGLQGSMGRVASAGDNAAMESWHALLQRNVLDRRRWRTHDDCTRRSCSGPSTPTTAGAASAHSESSPRSSSDSPSPTRPQPLRHDHHSPGVNRPCSSPSGMGRPLDRLDPLDAGD